MSSKWDDSVEQQALPPRRSSGRLIGLFVMLGVVLVVVIALRRFVSSHDAAAQPAVGQVISQLQLTPLDGDGQPLTSSDLEGKVTLINFWGPWCPPCRAEFPELMELRERLASQSSFQFVSVTCMYDANEGNLTAETKAFLSSKGYELPVYRDSKLTTRSELQQLNRSEGFAYPTTVLIDQQGVIQGLWIGYRTGVTTEMRQRIDELLAREVKGSAL